MGVKNKKSKWLNYFVLIVFSIIILIPIIWLMMTSLKYFKDIITTKIIFKPNFQNYIGLFKENRSFANMFMNSLIIAVSTMLVSTFLASLGAYSLVKLPWKKSTSAVISTVLLSLEIIPAITIIIPLYSMGMSMHMIDTKLYIILIYSLFNVPFVFFLMASYYRGLPAEIEESGFIDGASRFRIFFELILPLTIPIMMTGALFSFIFAWKEFLIGLSLTSTPRAMTLNVKIASFIQSYSVKYGHMSAASALGAIPGLILCIFTQKYIVSGITNGSVKG